MTISHTDFSERKTFSNSLAGSVMDSNNLLSVLFSVNVLFQLNVKLMLLLSCLSIYFFFSCICEHYKCRIVNLLEVADINQVDKR